MRLLKAILLSILVIALYGCTYVHSPTMGTYISVMQRKSADLTKTSGTLTLHYNTDSDQMAEFLKNITALAAKAAAK